MRLRRGYLKEPLRTVYIGGGTPSQLRPALLERLFSNIDTSRAVEVTMECNPDDVSVDYACAIGRLPVNRVSMGAQTFSDVRLRFINRRHNAHQVVLAIENLRRVGVDNISIDLMYGFPGETMDDWRNDIKKALSLGVEHVSAYCLMYEKGTPLYNMLQKGELSEIDEELSRAMYYELCDALVSAGYEHYEISNFARPGHRSLHNGNYWRTVPYMGIGAAAHSFDGDSRQWNVADVKGYIAGIDRGEVPAEVERLDGDTRYNDTVMLALRTCDGINLAELERRHGRKRSSYCLEQSARYVADGLLVLQNGALRLSREGLFVSDMIMSDLMIV